MGYTRSVVTLLGVIYVPTRSVVTLLGVLWCPILHPQDQWLSCSEFSGVPWRSVVILLIVLWCSNKISDYLELSGIPTRSLVTVIGVLWCPHKNSDKPELSIVPQDQWLLYSEFSAVPRQRRVWRYQRGNQNPYIEEEQTTQWSKEKVQKGKQRSTKHTYKTEDRVTRTPL